MIVFLSEPTNEESANKPTNCKKTTKEVENKGKETRMDVEIEDQNEQDEDDASDSSNTSWLYPP